MPAQCKPAGGVRIDEMLATNPKLAALQRGEEIYWTNPLYLAAPSNQLRRADGSPLPLTIADIDEADARLTRFAPYIARVFPETAELGGIIESPLKDIEAVKPYLEATYGPVAGRLLLKCDSHLPISGSVKARGGIYEVLKVAETLAVEGGMLSYEDDYSVLAEERFRRFFSRYSMAVGSTGNLGLSIGIMSAALGFSVTVHMSADARQWKKDLLRSRGVHVVEYPDDYQKAVAEGRRLAAADPRCHFVDDESSTDLFLGYAVAARRLKRQLEDDGIAVDAAHPLFVYIPCGVGGAPGGVAFGLKTIFGPDVHIFFAEPTHAPCMTLSMMTGLENRISVYDLGLDGRTEADGLAVGRASALVCRMMETLLSGCYTIEDEKLYPFLAALSDSCGIRIEPSACASQAGPFLLCADTAYLATHALTGRMRDATHILWATGGSMVPPAEMEGYYQRGRQALAGMKERIRV